MRLSTVCLLLAGLILISFKGKGHLSTVSFKIKNDTLSLKNGSTSLQYQISFTNNTKKNIEFPNHLRAAYEDNLTNDYYLIIHKIGDTTRSQEPFERMSYFEAFNPGPFLNIKPSQRHTKEFATNFYPIEVPGIYIVQFVFANDLSFLGKSNLDTLVVLP
ncbi:hypothetical protein [Taibaiella koreensis]|uniref:hypothetical protein n=1 Tax=Taibaiella koreensis TaxID=1268548 RepID=UPI0013C2FF5B|nr:hypothetical protein [Taibaiella koreensis]